MNLVRKAVMAIVSLLFFIPSCKQDNKIQKTEGMNVLLVTIDTLRADRVGYSGYAIETPNLDFLAKTGARFMNAVCQVPLTLPSHASILTGTNPPFHQIKNNGTYYLHESLITLPEILKEKGYQTAAFIGAFPLESQFGLDQGFDFYDDRFKNPDHLKGYEPQRIAEDVYRSAARWFESIPEKKFFVWVHYYDPHLPYTPPSPYAEENESEYDGEIAYTDVYVGKLIEQLERREVYEETLIVVVGDHGEGLGDHKEDTHGIFLYDATLKVPLLMHSPGSIPKGLKIDKQVRTIDICPTVLDMLGIPLPENCQGKSLVPLMEGADFEIESYGETYLPLIACGWSALKSIRTNRWKFIQAPRPELYDLKSDPLEKRNVIEEEKDVVAALQKSLEDHERESSFSGDRKSFKTLSLEDQEKLAALGYIGGAGDDGIVRESNIDPKDKIHIFEGTLRAELALSQGSPEKAEGILKEFLAQDPSNPMIRHFLGKTYQQLGDWDKSIQEFKKAIDMSPNDVFSHYFLAVSYYRKGMTTDAIREAKRVLSFLGNHFESLLLLAEIHGNSGDYNESTIFLEQALEVNPDNLELRLLYADFLTLAKKYDRAYDEYLYVVDRAPDDPEAYHKVGNLCYLRNDFEQSIQYFLKELELHTNPDAYFSLGMAYGKLGKYREAVTYLEKYLISLPSSEIEKRNEVESAIDFFTSKIT